MTDTVIDPTALTALIDRYVAQWHETDPAARRRLIEAIWAPDGSNYTASFEVHGHDALETRVRTAHEKWVRDEACVFRPRHTAAHHDAIRFVWDMARCDGTIASVGVEILLLAPDGRIRADYQFIEPAA